MKSGQAMRDSVRKIQSVKKSSKTVIANWVEENLYI